MRPKRKHEETTSTVGKNNQTWWWKTLEDDIQSHGGFLHENLQFCSESRSLKVLTTTTTTTTTMTTDHLPVDGDTSLIDTSLVMCIPKASMITRDLALQLLQRWWPNVEVSLQNLHDAGKLYSSVNDIILGLALAFETIAPPSSSRENCITRAYLATLPDSSTYWKALPWRWSDEALQNRLGGSPLLLRVQQAKQGIRNDISHLSEEYTSSINGKSNEIFDVAVLMEQFRDMLAAVSSRAFVIDSSTTTTASTQEVALIPILDLCDHCRGGQGEMEKNLSYTIQDGSMVVRSTKDVSINLTHSVGDTLRLTYGAKGNSQLLMNYGFAISDNFEPDGSSNDILEFTIPNPLDDTMNATIQLRTGPKSYTYGCLVKVLETFHSPNNLPDKETSDRNSLNELFEDEDDGGEYDDDDADELDIYSSAGCLTDGNSDHDLEAEVIALRNFAQAIEQCLNNYSLEDSVVHDILSKNLCDPDYYSALLIQSEKRILKFYAAAVCKILTGLQQPGPTTTSAGALHDDSLQNDPLLKSQVEELAKAYMTIRHSPLL